jgi:hypothetical protein
MLSNSGHILPEHAYGYPARANVHGGMDEIHVPLTPVHESISYHPKYMKALLEKGARANAAGWYKTQPLHLLTRPVPGHLKHQHGSIGKKINLLLGHGADINARDNFGETPLHRIARHPWQSGSDTAVEKLVQRGANVHAVDKFGRTPRNIAMGLENLYPPPPNPDTARRVIQILKNAERTQIPRRR